MTQRFVPAILVLSLFPLSCGLTSSEEKARDLYSSQAKFWIDGGRYREGLQQSLKGLEIDPGNYTLNMQTAYCYLRMPGRENLYRALPYLDECDSQNIFSSDWKLDLLYGVAYHRMGKEHQLTVDEFRRGADEAKDPIAKAQALAKEQEHLAKMAERYEQSIHYLERTLEGDPGNPEALDNLQQVHANVGNYAQALSYGDVLLRLAENTRIQLENDAKRPDLPALVEEKILLALARNKERTATIRGLRASIYRKVGDHRKAIEELDIVLGELAPRRYEENYFRAESKLALGDSKGAIQDYMGFLRRASLEREEKQIKIAHAQLTNLGVDIDQLARLQAEQVRDELIGNPGTSQKKDEN